MGDSTTAGTPAFKSPREAPPAGSGDETSQYAYWLMKAHPDWEVINQGINAQPSDVIAARFDEDVIIETRVAEANSRIVSFGYEMRLVDGRKLATGMTRHIFCNREMKPVRLPAKYRVLFGIA